MKVSVFKIGLMMVIIGMIGVSIIFYETEIIHDSTLLNESNSIESKLEFSLIMMLISYLKIKNYNIEQPDENIS